MADEGGEKSGIPWKELMVDKSIDAILIPVGLFAALWLQNVVEQKKEREDYVALIADFRTEVVGNRAKVGSLEKDIGPLGDTDPEKVLGPLQVQLDGMKDDSEQLSALFDCADMMFDLAVKAPGLLAPEPTPKPEATPPAPSPTGEVAVVPEEAPAPKLAGAEVLDEEELAEVARCQTLFEKFEKEEPATFTGVDLSPFYGYVVWTVYLQNGIKLFKDPQAKGLGLKLGGIYAAQREVETRLDDIETLFNESLMKSSGKLAALVAESDDLLPDEPTPDVLRAAQERLQEMSEEAFDLRYEVENLRNILSLKVARLKGYVNGMNTQLDEVIQALDTEQTRIGKPD